MLRSLLKTLLHSWIQQKNDKNNIGYSNHDKSNNNSYSIKKLQEKSRSSYRTLRSVGCVWATVFLIKIVYYWMVGWVHVLVAQFQISPSLMPPSTHLILSKNCSQHRPGGRTLTHYYYYYCGQKLLCSSVLFETTSKCIDTCVAALHNL